MQEKLIKMMSREIINTKESKCNIVKTLTLLYTSKAMLKKLQLWWTVSDLTKNMILSMN